MVSDKGYPVTLAVETPLIRTIPPCTRIAHAYER
jgi:hypothetical protein